MRIYMEYLRRHRFLNCFFRPPCACFVESKTDASRVAIGIHEVPNKPFFMLKYWDLNVIALKSPLPEFVIGYRSEEEILAGRFLPDGYAPVSYETPAIPTMYNSENHPMSEAVYFDRYDRLLESGDKTLSRKLWLWDSFLTAYQLPIDRRINGILASNFTAVDRFRHQMEMVEYNHRRHLQYWNMWCQHMIEFPNNGLIETIITSSSCDDDDLA